MLDWIKTPSGGYALIRDGKWLGPVLVRNGRTWSLLHDGHRVNLGRRASFDTAEAALVRLGFVAR